MKRAIILFIATLTLFSCGKRLLQDYTDCPEQPLLFPDYTDITVPCNIAPLNFQLEGAANLSVIIQGKKEYQFDSQSYRLQFPIKKWKRGYTVCVCLCPYLATKNTLQRFLLVHLTRQHRPISQLSPDRAGL